MTRMLFLVLTILLFTLTTQAAAPVGQTIWIRASANGLFVSADQNRGAWAPLVADRTSTDAWEQFQVVDAGGGFIAFRSIGTGLFVSADQARATWAPLVADRAAIGTWEQFTWSDIAGGAFTLRGRSTNRFVSADLARASFGPLVCDRTVANTWEQFTWGAVGAPPAPGGAPPRRRGWRGPRRRPRRRSALFAQGSSHQSPDERGFTESSARARVSPPRARARPRMKLETAWSSWMSSAAPK